ncbi:hypothetical protein [Streptomyces boluensis]|uniref:TFIIB-type zinc ribbon-containing protein n=1 Tax=Streptomyces boluensis TaxID=1775135 RepID=A0A964ULE6_9ACTN|nr:hypothetical protein [Streptomyces boluensis]NBE50671.1 hypothetical protein [Streptomyces boluensis]
MDSASPDGPARHHDPGGSLAQFAGRILVVCERCGGRAVVVPRPGLPAPRHSTELLFQPRRVACARCGGVAEWEPEARGGALVGAVLGGTEDPFFHRPLWLQVRCAGHVLWAYDAPHVDALSAYVDARLRERGGLAPTRAMFARLPAWMKVADNRTDVLAGLRTLRALSERSAPGDRSDAAHERGDKARPHRSFYFRSTPYPPGP